MKAIIEYDLNDRDERMAHLRAIKSMNMANALFEIKYNLRTKLKYELDDIADVIFEKIDEILYLNNINIDELTY